MKINNIEYEKHFRAICTTFSKNLKFIVKVFPVALLSLQRCNAGCKDVKVFYMKLLKQKSKYLCTRVED